MFENILTIIAEQTTIAIPIPEFISIPWALLTLFASPALVSQVNPPYINKPSNATPATANTNCNALLMTADSPAQLVGTPGGGDNEKSLFIITK